MSAITDNLPAIGWGLLVTLVISVLSYLGGLLLGSLMAIFRVGPIPPLRALGAAWVTVACNIPNLCLMVLVGLALPHVGITIPLFWSVIVALVFSSSGFVCETVRSGINSVPKGQVEAARALGMPFGLIIRGIVLPQALARTIQPLVNIFIACLIGSPVFPTWPSPLPPRSSAGSLRGVSSSWGGGEHEFRRHADDGAPSTSPA